MVGADKWPFIDSVKVLFELSGGVHFMSTKTIALLAVLLVGVLAIGSLGNAFAVVVVGNSTSTATVSETAKAPVTLQFTATNIFGMLSGAIWAGIGYARAKQNGQGFDASNAAPTVFVGFVIGLITSISGLPFDQVSNYSIVQMITIIVDKLFVGSLKKPSPSSAATVAGPKPATP